MIVALLVTLLLIGIVTLYSYITPDYVQQQITKSLAYQYGLQVQAQNVQLQLLPDTEIVLDTLKFSTPDGVEVGQAQTMTVDLSVWSLFAQRPIIKAIRIDQASIDLSSSNGLSTLLPSFATIQAFHLVNSEIKLNHQIELNKLNLDIQAMDSRSALYAVKSALQSADVQGDFSLSGSIAQSKTNEEGWILGQTQQSFKGFVHKDYYEIQSQIGSAYVNQTQALSWGKNISLDVRMDHLTQAKIQVPEVKWRTHQIWSSLIKAQFFTTLNAQNENDPSTGPLIAELQSDIQWSLDTRKLQIEAFNLTSYGQGDFNTPSFLKGQLTFNSEDYSGLLKATGQIWGMPLHTALTFGKGLSQDEGLLSASVMTLPIEVQGNIDMGLLKTQYLSLLPKFSYLLKDFVYSGELSIAGVEGYGLCSLKSSLTIRDGQALLNHLKGNCLDGQLEAKAQLTQKGQWHALLNLDRANLSELLKLLRLQVPFEGLMGKATLDIQGDANKGVDKLSLELTSHQGVLKGIDVVQAFDILKNERPSESPIEVSSTLSNTPMNALILKVVKDASQGLDFQVTQGILTGTHWDALLAGSIGEQGQLQFQAVGKDPSSSIEMPLVWQWNRSSSKMTLDWQHAKEKADQLYGAKELSTKLIKDRVERVIKEFWGEIFIPESSPAS